MRGSIGWGHCSQCGEVESGELVGGDSCLSSLVVCCLQMVVALLGVIVE